jgi:putative acetyltransferase
MLNFKIGMALIREEIPDDYAAMRELNCTAFEGEAEGQLVDRLRSDGLVVVSLVAVEGGDIVGHILFSDLVVEADQAILDAVSLAPMAVAPSFQRRGIGSALVRLGLAVCRERGKSVVVVLGHPEYFPRFGFSRELAKNLRGPYSGDAWMALELIPDALDGVQGTVRYPKAFDIFSWCTVAGVLGGGDSELSLPANWVRHFCYAEAGRCSAVHPTARTPFVASWTSTMLTTPSPFKSASVAHGDVRHTAESLNIPILL